MSKRVVKINIRDMGLHFFIDLGDEDLRLSFSEEEAVAEITSSFADFTHLALGREDADAMFFSGRVDARGDTAPVVELRNRVENMDFSPLREKLGPIGELLWN